MDDHLRNQIRNNLLLKETVDLLEIWQKGSRDDWTDDVFEIVKEILFDRLGYLPDQSVEKQVNQILQEVDRQIQNGELHESLVMIESAIRMDPELATVYIYRANIYDEMDQLDYAIADYRKALQLNPDLKEAWKNIKSIEDELEVEYQNSISKQHLDQALEFAYSDQPEKALEECELARVSLLEIAPAYNFLGIVLQELNQIEPAIDSYLKAIQLNPRFYSARENLRNARVWLEEEQYYQASQISEVDELKEIETSNIVFDESQLIEQDEIDNLIPGWYYLDEKAFTLVGWPGHRTRPGRSGYDPLDSDFEQAHVTGMIIRSLITGKFRTRNPIYLFFMTCFGLYFCLPLLGLPGLLLSGWASIYLMVMLSPYLIVGFGLLVNVFLSFRIIKSAEKDEKGRVFF